MSCNGILSTLLLCSVFLTCLSLY